MSRQRFGHEKITENREPSAEIILIRKMKKALHSQDRIDFMIKSEELAAFESAMIRRETNGYHHSRFKDGDPLAGAGLIGFYIWKD